MVHFLIYLYPKDLKKTKQARYTQENLEKVELKLFNKTHNTISGLQKRQDIACFMTLNEGKKQFHVKYETVQNRKHWFIKYGF